MIGVDNWGQFVSYHIVINAKTQKNGGSRSFTFRDNLFNHRCTSRPLIWTLHFSYQLCHQLLNLHKTVSQSVGLLASGCEFSFTPSACLWYHRRLIKARWWSVTSHYIDAPLNRHPVHQPPGGAGVEPSPVFITILFIDII